MNGADITQNQDFLVIDFETTTPKGYSPEPIEVGAVAGTILECQPNIEWKFESFIRPPEHAPLTWFDTQQTGITDSNLVSASGAGEVLGHLDSTVKHQILVAHNATVEANILFNYREACPRLARRDILCSWRLAKEVLPGRKSHRLDALMGYYSIPARPDRHRALADVELTFVVLAHLLRDLEELRAFDRQHALSKAILQSQANKPTQFELF